MSTLQMMIANTAISVLFGHFWGGTIWPWIKAKLAARLSK